MIAVISVKEGVVMPKSMKIDYYRVLIGEEDQQNFDSIIEKISNFPNDESRNYFHNNIPIRLQEMEKREHLWIGDMVKIRLNDIPPKTKMSGRQIDIDLDEDEGLGEETAFLYDQDVRVLVLQRNYTAVTAAGFTSYFKYFGNVKKLNLLPVVKPEAYQRMEKMNIVRRFEIDFAGLQNLSIAKGSGKGANAMVDLANETDSPYQKVILSMGNQKGTIARIRSFVEEVLSLFKENVKKIKITGKEFIDGETEIIDLLEDRMVDIEELDLPRGDHDLARKIRKQALYRAWNNRIPELEMMFLDPEVEQ